MESTDKVQGKSRPSREIELTNRSTQKLSQRVIEEDSQDSLIIPKKLQSEEYIFVAILLVGIIAIIGLINRRVENAMLFALFISGIIIVLFFGLLG